MKTDKRTPCKIASPLRYPGGKAILVDFLDSTIELNDLRGGDYYEPYAGGAGAALGLLSRGVVSKLFLNDADHNIFSFWQSVLVHADRFVEMIGSVPLTIDEWHRQHDICLSPSNYSVFDVGFATFYMNRCNRSGVIAGAGPIGGYKQSGKWKLDVRFNRDELSARVLAIAKDKDRITISCLDALDFLKQCLPRGSARRKSFVYLDPPYVVKGQRLYLNAYAKGDHIKLARYINAQSTLPWIMSYDDNDVVRGLYSEHWQFDMPIKYSLQDKRTASELIIAPHHVNLPAQARTALSDQSVKTAV